MTRDHSTHSTERSRVRRCVAAGVIGAVVGLTAVGVGTGADAARRTKSTTIADAAALAVDALDRWEQSHSPVDYVRFVQHRDFAASMTETEIELPDGSLRDAWASAPLVKQDAVLSAVSQLGVPYRSLASKPGVGFDCSGLTIWAFSEAGVEIARVSRDQINESEAIEREDAVAGDLVYYPGHISIYLGADMMVHSPNSGSHVEVTRLPERSLRFGDAAAAATPAPAPATPAVGSLVDGALAVTE